MAGGRRETWVIYGCHQTRYVDKGSIYMYHVRITAVRQTVYTELSLIYENPIEHTCDVKIGDTFLSVNGERPADLCESAWDSMRVFVEELARGGGNFFDGWMKNPKSAMISCNDGFRPVSFYIETVEGERGV